MAIYIFYDSSSKMYLIYSTLCYVTTILIPTTSYVLISANLDDFKSIASRFIPEELAGVADIILERAKDAFIDDHSENKAVFRHKTIHKGPVKKTGNKNGTLGSVNKLIAKKKHKNITKESPLHFKIDLDEFVENIKNKLHSEFQKLTPNDNKSNKTNIKFKNLKNVKNTTQKRKEKKALRVLMSHKSRPIKQSRGNVTQTVTTRGNNQEQRPNITQDNHKKKRPIDKRYLGDVFVAKPPEHILNYGKHKNTVAPKKSNITIDAVVIKNRKPNILRQKSKYLEVFTTNLKPKSNKQVKVARGNNDEENKPPFKLNSKYLDTATENTKTSRVADSYVGYDLINTNDSYEDYVPPEKDVDYKEPLEEATSPKTERKLKTFSAMRQGPIIKNKKVFDVFSDVDKVSIKTDDGVHYDDDTANNPDGTDKKNIYESIIHPYVEQFEAEINNMNSELTEANKKIPSAKPIFWNVAKTEKNKKGKSKAATLIPKRDFYKISSPNYLLKVPIIGEKYHFDEPIPEEDRDSENLKYIGNPPAKINGKVVFSA